MPAQLQPIKQFVCTFPACPQSFDTEKEMMRHKRFADEHDYCHKCNQDFESCEDLAQHKIFRPDKHDKACRICGDEFKSVSGLKCHINRTHKVDQQLPCLGCGEVFYRASLMVEHLEFGHCTVVGRDQFMGHIVHKHLITELLKGGAAYDRFVQKISKFDAAQDFEEEGGVGLDDVLDDGTDAAREVRYEAIQPEYNPEEQYIDEGPYPPLPSSRGGRSTASVASDLTATMDRMSLGGPASRAPSVAGSSTAYVYGNSSARGSSSAYDTASAYDVSSNDGGTSTYGGEASTTAVSSSGRELKPWAGRSSKALFPNAKPTPAPSEYSIAAHDQQMEQEHGINIMTTRFWDPLHRDWNPDRFLDSLTQRYFCPFICEQTFDSCEEMNTHIMTSHRITRMKCPSCLKYYKSVTALMAHCESKGSKCQINRADDFSIFLNKLTGGFISVRDQVRPDHRQNPSVIVHNPRTGRPEPYTPPAVSYLQYTTSKPVDWKDPVKVAAQIGNDGTGAVFEHQGQLARWE